MSEWVEHWLGWSIMDGAVERAFVVLDEGRWYWRANFPGDFKEGRGFQDGKVATKILAQRSAMLALTNTSDLLNGVVKNLPVTK